MTTTISSTDGKPLAAINDPRGAVKAVALVLPGGKAHSQDPMSPRQLASLRMIPFAKSLHHAGAEHGLAVWLQTYQVRGWNGPSMSPVHDAVRSLDAIRERHGDVPVAVVGHSMGGRTAISIAGDESVRSVVALAPWVEPGDPYEQLRGRALLVAHGNADMITRASESKRLAEQAALITAPVARFSVKGDSHAMLSRWRTWHRLTTDWSMATLGFAPMSDNLTRAIELGRDGNFSVAI